MDQVHARALEALQPFILLAKSTSASSPRFIANIITNATSSPQTYVFAELLELPTVQALRSPDTPAEFQGHLKLLEIFANPRPTRTERRTNNQTPPPLPLVPVNNNQTPNLHLSKNRPLLRLNNRPRIADNNSNLRLPDNSPPLPSQQTTLGERNSRFPLRDVQPTSLPKMISILTEWESRCGNVVSDLEAEIARVKTDAAKRAHKKYTYDQRLEKAVERRQNGASGEAGGGRRGNRARFGAGLGGSKRDADDIDQDDGFFETGDGESSRMDIDEGAGAGARSGNSRSKRVLGRKS
ncbi:hypothetical protein N7499_000438 [Penicillium canescens]|uniref:Uncharacterized protein n=1 Tax=Penicillium canescens TaxID=5083 RepID=A0AAD6IGS9_PENCN|nr:hypothetical protein N7444_012279 [Penicillium canescens]KAJ6047723.1 hypothetical protein N7460_003870 [Penicillium canescens]KAJ6100808.1 hypothetical protein N7499_000438 [Penicillium canescens]